MYYCNFVFNEDNDDRHYRCGDEDDDYVGENIDDGDNNELALFIDNGSIDVIITSSPTSSPPSS